MEEVRAGSGARKARQVPLLVPRRVSPVLIEGVVSEVHVPRYCTFSSPARAIRPPCWRLPARARAR